MFQYVQLRCTCEAVCEFPIVRQLCFEFFFLFVIAKFRKRRLVCDVFSADGY